METFKSPVARLARLFQTSRDAWKAKALDKQRRLRAAQVKIRDLEASRAQWKERALAAEAEAAHRDAEPHAGRRGEGEPEATAQRLVAVAPGRSSSFAPGDATDAADVSECGARQPWGAPRAAPARAVVSGGRAGLYHGAQLGLSLRVGDPPASAGAARGLDYRRRSHAGLGGREVSRDPGDPRQSAGRDRL